MEFTPMGFFVFSFSFFASAGRMKPQFSSATVRAKSRSYEDLIAWRKALDLAQGIYLFTQEFPKDETYGLRQQARRSAVSISANIAEGQARNGIKEFIQFLGIANGSLAELKTYLYLSGKLGLGERSRIRPLLNECEIVAQLLNALKISLRKTENEKQKTSFSPRQAQ